MTYLHQIDPIALSAGPLKIHWYGVMYLLAFASAWWLGRSRIRAGRLPGTDMNAFSDLLFYGMLGVVLGGRIGYILFYSFGAFLENPLMIFKVWEGGMSFHGGLLGVMLAGLWWTRRQKLHYFDTMDFVAPLIPLGLGLGRIGNFIGAELWGKYTHAGWGVIFPSTDPNILQLKLSPEQLQAQYAAGALDGFARHPSQLYQAFLEGVLMFAIVWWFSSKPRPRYAVAGMFALLYGVFRFLVEFVRMPDEGIGYLAFGWLTMGQVLSLPLIALGLFLFWMARRSPTLHPVLPAKEST
ncbi:prolipoprotein diacylglyceryl transferase [Pseudoxanthomonas gei]|uniref:Phosphatidylglycerol--prolipoprotein diacylglyceryl transferase n=1 Tax=Pseudoxanthomonas gei TaxID=1383030 RepID=A0ABX0AF50_9GAMM|nr:prolipoprotein diacylglyceryl transferase [Pseudoxanthomonas gei]NDK40227.1 prolipoprotein diacylglyceryl transferase [Pseudoxanthomonas gei]